jgi:hypothetical protein
VLVLICYYVINPFPVLLELDIMYFIVTEAEEEICIIEMRLRKRTWNSEKYRREGYE